VYRLRTQGTCKVCTLGLLVILEAIKVLANPRLHLVVAGDDRPEKFSAAVNKAGLNNQLHFIGKCEDMHALYPIADASRIGNINIVNDIRIAVDNISG
jgi:hypothetical protein